MIQPFADLHIHLGSTWEGQPVKISASKNLTIPTIMDTAVHKKGIQMIGIIDCHVPAVIEQLQYMLDDGELLEHEEGGLIYDSGCLILGSEIEIYDENCKGPIHVLVYLPYLDSMKHFSEWLSQRMTNPTLSSQRYYGSAIELQEKTHELGGLFVIAHAFTPFKSLYGKGVERNLSEVFDPAKINAIELGLSADTEMADQLSELHSYPYLSNSDAHSLEKIGREYQQIQVDQLSFQELEWALKGQEGRKLLSNFGLHPKLGKYYQTRCSKCGAAIEELSMKRCPHCEKGRVVKGVSNRVAELADTSFQLDRPPFVHHVPLDFIPGLGPNTLRKLREKFGTDMEIIHFKDREALESILPTRLVEKIIQSRTGSVAVEAGGAGKYGKLR
ncbi:endonuclease Q family protein [Pseudalkalibacillus sp. Hm43]|uniref:endonuclease Q family protein n=1 Tax=Pseudalkalibacillus sp. Hm43 TaxID=3450742 RepID=UPI003F41EAEC